MVFVVEKISLNKPATESESQKSNWSKNSSVHFDWPACFQIFSNRPDKSPHPTEPIRRRTQWAFLKSRDSTKMFRRSDFRNARSVRNGIHQINNKLSVSPIKHIGYAVCEFVRLYCLGARSGRDVKSSSSSSLWKR